jgi:hypothetical protein
MKTFLCVVSPTFPENYYIGISAGKWGVEERYKQRIGKVSVGDELVFIADQKIKSIHRIESPVNFEDSPLWPPKKGDLFPWRIKISAPLFKGAIPKDVFKDQISFMRGKVWGGTIQGASGVFNERLNQEDMAFIKANLSSVQIEAEMPEPADSKSQEPTKMFKILNNEVLSTLNQILPSLGLQRYNGADFPAEYDLGFGGNIILCRDQSNSDLVVLDFINGDADDESLLCLLHYMSWVRQNLSKKEGVRGVILCGSSSKSLELVVLEVPNVQIAKYRLGIQLLNSDVAS